MGDNASLIITVPPGMVYTDTEGRIVYANRQFLELLSMSSERSPVGSMLEETLHLEPAALREFGALRERYSLRRLALIYQRADETRAIFLLTSVPANDQRGKFVGMNIGMETRANMDGLEGVPTLEAPGRVLPVNASDHAYDDPGLNGRYLELVLNALQATLARMAGPRVREGFVAALDQLARKHNWPIHAENDQLALEHMDIPAEIVARMIAEALDYTVAVLGQRVILHEIEELYAQIDPRLQDHALQTGLSLPLIKRLAT